MKKRKRQIFTLLALALVLLISLLTFPDSELTKRLNQNSNLLLVVLTAVYVVVTYLLLESARKSSLEQTRPFVYASLPVEGAEIFLSIRNVGNRPAHNVVATFNPSIDVLASSQREGTCEPLLKQSFLPPNFELRNLLGSAVEVVQEGTNRTPFNVTLSYADSDGNPFTHEYMISLGSYVFDKQVVSYASQHYLKLISASLTKVAEHFEKQK